MATIKLNSIFPINTTIENFNVKDFFQKVHNYVVENKISVPYFEVSRSEIIFFETQVIKQKLFQFIELVIIDGKKYDKIENILICTVD